MDNETMTLNQLANLLNRDARELQKWANRGYLPAQRVGGEWRFTSAEIKLWLETKLPSYTEQELSDLERGAGSSDTGPLVTSLLTVETMAVPLQASTRSSVLKELVKVGEGGWQVYDPDALLNAIKAREDIASTAFPGGVAIPHPRRPQPDTVQGEAFIAFGRTASQVPFGGEHGGMTDLFFLVCCRDQRTHIRVLARLSRLLLQPGLLENLREADSAVNAWNILRAAELQLSLA